MTSKSTRDEIFTNSSRFFLLPWLMSPDNELSAIGGCLAAA